MRLHVVALPHTEPVRRFDHCAYTAKVRRFCHMMTGRTRSPISLYYAGDEAGVPSGVERVQLFDTQVQQALLAITAGYDPGNITSIPWDASLPIWQVYNKVVLNALEERLEPDDLVLLIAGRVHQPIIDRYPNQTVEFGVGYSGVAARYRCFESYAWMHSVYAAHREPMSVDGVATDTVIPNYYDGSEFPAGDGQGGYLLYISRMEHRKGWQTAVDVAEHTGLPLKVAGIHNPVFDPLPNTVEHVGIVHGLDKAALFGDAIATLVPTQYVEPFGGVAVESMLCGTPVITSDWGAFTETVDNSVTGYRCRTLTNYIQAVERAPLMDRQVIRTLAHDTFTYPSIAPRYNQWFVRITGTVTPPATSEWSSNGCQYQTA